jgi:hypothetical protein
MKIVCTVLKSKRDSRDTGYTSNMKNKKGCTPNNRYK